MYSADAHSLYTGDRSRLCKDLLRLSRLYGIITGSSVKHPCKEIERELQHLRSLRIHTHRPHTLRLLRKLDQNKSGVTEEEVSKVLAAIGTWITRLWLVDQPLNGLNTAVSVAAFRHVPK